VAILGIVLYHFFPNVVPGGYIGVDVFFTLSGFLIASSLLRSQYRYGKLRIGHYVLQRARRIVPPLVFVVLVTLVAAWAINSDLLVGVGGKLTGIFTFSYNWTQIAAGANYFATMNPSVFQQLWYVSVAVQQYILAPVLLWAVMRIFRNSTRGPQRWGSRVFAVLALISAVLMAVLFVSGGDPTRVYFGTDTHSFGFFIGMALAFGVYGHLNLPRDSSGKQGSCKDSGKSNGDIPHTVSTVIVVPRRLQRLLPACGAIAVVLLVVGAIFVHEGTTAFRGGLLGVAILTVVAILGLTTQNSWLASVFSCKPLTVLGKYSYGIYLWHWAALTLVQTLLPQFNSAWNPTNQIIAAVVTVLFTFLSYSFIEKPFVSLEYSTRYMVLRVVAVIVIGASLVVCAGVAVASAPSATRTERLLEQNAKLLSKQSQRSEQSQHQQPKEPAKKVPQPQKSQEQPHGSQNPLPQNKPKVSTQPEKKELPTGSQITAIGDSVMLASLSSLQQSYPGISVDAQVSRQMDQGISTINSLKASDKLREFVIVGLGTNGYVSTAQYEEILKDIGPKRVLIIVNCYGNREWVAPNNAVIAQFVGVYKQSSALADWNAQAAAHPGDLYPDGIHPKPPNGGKYYVAAIRAALQKWQNAG
jgi:peptidoglycan/LPS O-acetylase OafA/YrhL